MSMREQATRDLESILDSCRHSGTKMIFAEYKNLLDHMVQTAADQCDTTEKWFQRRGEIAALRMVLATEDNAKRSLEGLPEQTFPDEAPKEETNPLED